MDYHNLLITKNIISVLVDCGAPPSTANGEVDSTTLTTTIVGSIVSYNCSTGYWITNTKHKTQQVKCTLDSVDATTASWGGVVCERMYI